MAKQLGNCPHCQKPILSESVTSEEMAVAFKDFGKQLESQWPKAPPPPDLKPLETKVDDLCSKFPDLCNRVDALTEQTKPKEEKGHFKPTPEAVKQWESCPDCKPEWDKRKGEIEAEARKGYVPKEEEKAKEIPPPAEVKPARPVEPPPKPPEKAWSLDFIGKGKR